MNTHFWGRPCWVGARERTTSSETHLFEPENHVATSVTVWSSISCHAWAFNSTMKVSIFVTAAQSYKERDTVQVFWSTYWSVPRTFVPSTREPTSSTVRANIIEKRVRDAIIFRHPSQARVKKKIWRQVEDKRIKYVFSYFCNYFVIILSYDF